MRNSGKYTINKGKVKNDLINLKTPAKYSAMRIKRKIRYKGPENKLKELFELATVAAPISIKYPHK